VSKWVLSKLSESLSIAYYKHPKWQHWNKIKITSNLIFIKPTSICKPMPPRDVK
jgi:hypothetical protein